MATFDEDAPIVWQEMKAGGEKAWCVLSVDETDKKRLNLTGFGRCGVAHLKRYLVNDQIQFGAVRIFAINAAGFKQPKTIVFTFKGSDITLRMKTAAANLQSAVSKFFEGSHGEVEMNGLDQVTEETFLARLPAAGSGFGPVAYQFGTGNEDDLEVDELAAQEAARVAAEEAAAAAAAEAARIAAEEAARRKAEEEAAEARRRKLAMLPARTTTEARALERPAAIGGYSFTAITALQVLHAFHDESSSLAWVLFHLTEEEPKSFVPCAHGSGGMEEVVSHLRDDDIQYGAVRVTAVERKGTRLSIRPKYVVFTWHGPAASTKTKMRNTGASRIVAQYFDAPILELEVNGEKSDLSEAALQVKLGGIATTTREYRFGVYDADTQADEYIEQLAKLGLTGSAAEEAAAAAAAGVAAAST